MSDHVSTQDLINRIETKDRRFRAAQALFLALLLTLLIGVVFVQFRTLETVREQLVVSKATAAEATKQNEQTQQKIVRRLDCMVAFFSQTDRTNLRISDIEMCSLSKDDNLEEFFAPPNNTSSSTQTNDDGSETTTTTTQDTPGNPGATPPPTPVPQPPVVEPRPPVEVLGIPVCVPFTGVCLR